MNTQELKQALRNGPYAWPGGYPLYFITRGGDVLSFQAVKDNYRLVLADMRAGYPNGWGTEWVGVNWEDDDLFCDHTGERIPSAYGEGVMV